MGVRLGGRMRAADYLVRIDALVKLRSTLLLMLLLLLLLLLHWLLLRQ